MLILFYINCEKTALLSVKSLWTHDPPPIHHSLCYTLRQQQQEQQQIRPHTPVFSWSFSSENCLCKLYFSPNRYMFNSKPYLVIHNSPTLQSNSYGMTALGHFILSTLVAARPGDPSGFPNRALLSRCSSDSFMSPSYRCDDWCRLFAWLSGLSVKYLFPKDSRGTFV